MGFTPCGSRQVLTMMDETKPEKTELQFYADLISLKIPLPKPSHLFICRCSQRGLYCSKKKIRDQFNIKDSILFCFQKQDSCMVPKAS